MSKKKQGKMTSIEIIKDIKKLKESGLSQQEISHSCKISRRSVGRYLELFKAKDISYEDMSEMSLEELSERLGKKLVRGESKVVPIDFSYVSRELKRKGVTLTLLWEELLSQSKAAEFISYSVFCKRYDKWLKAQDYSMPQEHIAGDKIFVDFSGLTLSYAYESRLISVQIFVGILGASNYTYVEAVPDQKSLSWQQAHINMFNYFGGVSRLVIPDNLKSGVNKASFYEPQLNESYRRLAEHYGVGILPTRAYKPKDKSKVEKAVKDIQGYILARLRDVKFFSIFEINQAIEPLLKEFNSKKMEKYKASRIELFEKLDKPELKPLPTVSYEPQECKLATVHRDYHIQFDDNFYSVPYYFVTKKVWVHASFKTVKIFYDNKQVAMHLRNYGKNSRIYCHDHLPPAHKAIKSYSTESFLLWGESIGEHTHQLVINIFKSREHVEFAYRTIFGVKRLQTQHPDIFEAVCARANYYNITTIVGLKSIIENKSYNLLLSEDTPKESSFLHSNLRGKDSFK